ncbi:MAG: rod shape-determining protein MreD [Candidatus Aminicenantia bacterium]
MRDIIKIGVGLIIAFLIQTSIMRISVSSLLYINVFSLVVIYSAVTKGEVYGMFTGTIAGLIQDSFSFTIFGISGFSKTILGFLVGAVAQIVDVSKFLIIFILIFLGILIELTSVFFLHYLVEIKVGVFGKKIFFFQPLLTALLGSITFILENKVKQKWKK